MGPESIEASFLSIFALISFLFFYLQVNSQIKLKMELF